jgi:hypothetical protein
MSAKIRKILQAKQAEKVIGLKPKAKKQFFC